MQVSRAQFRPLLRQPSACPRKLRDVGLGLQTGAAQFIVNGLNVAPQSLHLALGLGVEYRLVQRGFLAGLDLRRRQKPLLGQALVTRQAGMRQPQPQLGGLPFALGPLEGHRLAIDVPVLTQTLGGLIRSGVLAAETPRPEPVSALPLETVA